MKLWLVYARQMEYLPGLSSEVQRCSQAPRRRAVPPALLLEVAS